MATPNKDLEFFKHRLSECEVCEFNSVNYDISKNRLGLDSFGLDRVKDSLIIEEDGSYFHKPFCTCCGCPLEGRCSVKELSCGLVEKPLMGNAKWGPVVATVPTDKNFFIELDSVRNMNITPLGSGIYLTYDADENNIVDEVSFVVNCHKEFKFLQLVGTSTMERSVLIKTEDLSGKKDNKEKGFRNPIKVLLKIPLKALPNKETTFNFNFKYTDMFQPGVEKSFGIILFFRKNG